MSDTSSSDEDSQLLREAVDTQFMNDDMFHSINNKKAKLTKEKLVNNNDIKNQPSLRPNKNEDEQFNLLDVTPQFREYVAKQLTKILDEKIVYKAKSSNDCNNKRKQKGGVKLLSDSKQFIKIRKSDKITRRIKVNVMDNNKNSSDSENEQKCKEIAVAPEDILNKKDVKNWSTRSKAPIFQYKSDQNGQLSLIE